MKPLATKCVEPAPLVHVIDDDDSVRNAVSMLLRSVGIECCSYASAEALLCQPFPNVPSCLLVDVRLKGISGLDLQQRLAQVRHELPMILMTGHGDITMSVRAMKAGAVDFAQAVPGAGSTGCRDPRLSQ